MKTSELRLGNWISFKGKWNGIIEELRSGSITIKNNDGVFPYDVFEGIELNEDILVKCGFVQTSQNIFEFNNYLFVNDTLIYLRPDIKRENIKGRNFKYTRGNFIADNIKYLHQLQNLYFALTGEELNIIL